MATIDEDDQKLHITIGVLGADQTPNDVLEHMGASVGIDREMIEALPVVDFTFPAQVRVRDCELVVHLSALPQEIQWCDAVLVVVSDADSLDLLDDYGFRPR